MTMYLYHWAAMSSNGTARQINDGITMRDTPIVSSDDYNEFREGLVEFLDKKGQQFNITSLSLISSPTHNGGENG